MVAKQEGIGEHERCAEQLQDSIEDLVNRFELGFEREPERVVLGSVARGGFTYFLARFPSKPMENLTDRQRVVATMVGGGLSLGDIAQHLNLSRSCVAKHLRRVYEKLNVDSRAELGKLVIVLEACQEPGFRLLSDEV